jgi:thioredoxin
LEAINVEDSSFHNEVINAEQPVLIYVWATWCGPCKMVGPAVIRLAKKQPERFKLVMANINDFEKTARTYNIKTTPTLLIFKDGKEVIRRPGVMMEAQIIKWLSQHL